LRTIPVARRIYNAGIILLDVALMPVYFIIVISALFVWSRIERRRTQRDYNPTRGWN
jgi:hypothetical protein